MNALSVTRTVTEVIGGMTLLFVLIKVNHVISLFKDQQQNQLTIIKNQTAIMATLKDFQDQAALIVTATQNISAYVQGTGMSTSDQDEALSAITGAVSNLTAAIPAAVTSSIAPITGSSTISIGGTTQLANSTSGGTWATSDTTIATIDANGNVTGIGAGTVNITYTIGSNSATLPVTVS